MSTIITTILIGFILWFNPGQTQNKPVNPDQIKTVKPEVTKPVSTPSPINDIELATFKTITKQKATPASSAINYKTPEPTLSDSKVITTLPNPQPVWDKKPISGEDYILELSKEELKNLGVWVSDSGLYYLNITPEGLMSEYFRPYFIWVTAPKKEGGRTKPFKNWIGHKENVLSFNSFYVNYSTNEQIINSNNNRITISQNENLKACYPTDISQQSLYFRPGVAPSVQNIFTILDSIPKEEVRNFIRTYQTDKLKSIDDTLVPVKIKLEKPELFGVKTKILWFVSNDDFYKALPERYSNKIRNFCETQKQIKKKYPDSNTVDYNYVYEYYDYLENQVNYIDLTKDELKKLGIWFINDSNIYKAGVEYRDKKRSIKWCKKPNYVFSSSSRNDTSILTLYASYYSNNKDKMLEKIHFNNKNFEQPKMNELIPIRVKKNMPEDFELPNDIIFWYAATEALFDSLPARIGDELKQDYRTIMIRRDPAVSLEEKSKLKSTCKYFEECKATLFDVNFTISPNPVGDEMNIDLQLLNPEKISIILFSITGRKIQTLMPLTSMQKGSQRLTFSTSEIGTGFFLITIQNNKGLSKSQRIVKL